jgi:hypothetical protein
MSRHVCAWASFRIMPRACASPLPWERRREQIASYLPQSFSVLGWIAWHTGTNSSSRSFGVNLWASQYSVMGTPLTSSMTKKRSAAVGGASVQHAGDVGVVHQGQRLPFRVEAGQDGLGVHTGLDDLDRDGALDWLGLLGHEDAAHAAAADLFDELVQHLEQLVPRPLLGPRTCALRFHRPRQI